MHYVESYKSFKVSFILFSLLFVFFLFNIKEDPPRPKRRIKSQVTKSKVCQHPIV